MNQTVDRLVSGYARRDEDRCNDRVTGPAFATRTSEEERDTERNRGQCVTDVVDQVGEERDGVGQQEHQGLQRRGDGEYCQADRDGSNAGAGANDRRVDEAVGMTMFAMVMVVSLFV